MADDIVTQLRTCVCWCNEFDGKCSACEAADEIKRLQVIVATVDNLHFRLNHDTCLECGRYWPCPTQRALHPGEDNDE